MDVNGEEFEYEGHPGTWLCHQRGFSKLPAGAPSDFMAYRRALFEAVALEGKMVMLLLIEV